MKVLSIPVELCSEILQACAYRELAKLKREHADKTVQLQEKLNERDVEVEALEKANAGLCNDLNCLTTRLNGREREVESLHVDLSSKNSQLEEALWCDHLLYSLYDASSCIWRVCCAGALR